MESIWVAELIISAKTAEKLSQRHGIEAQEVRDAVQTVAGLPYTWDDDTDRGLRVLVRVVIRGQQRLVVLYPVEHPMQDVWALGSCYMI